MWHAVNKSIGIISFYLMESLLRATSERAASLFAEVLGLLLFKSRLLKARPTNEASIGAHYHAQHHDEESSINAYRCLRAVTYLGLCLAPIRRVLLQRAGAVALVYNRLHQRQASAPI